MFIANPDVADVQVKSPSLIYLTAKAPGQTALYAVDAEDRVLLNAPVRVEHDLSRLRQSIHALAPGQNVTVSSVDNALVLGGTVASAGEAATVSRLADRDRQGDEGQGLEPDGGRDAEPGQYPGQGGRGEPRGAEVARGQLEESS